MSVAAKTGTFNPQPKSALDAAIAYSRRGWPVIPLHSITNGHCTCRERAECRSPGKHPRISAWQKKASTDEATVRGWWKRWPDANVGILTGAAPDNIALDVDPRNGGDDSLADLEHENGELPETVEALTGGGGRHILFAHPGGCVKSRNVAPGIDVKADGGYIVVEPSLHISGRPYAWELSHHPNDIALATLPGWLLELVREPSRGAGPITGNGEASPVAEGGRNVNLTSLAGTMRRRGMSEAAIRAALREENRRSCLPPLDESEVDRIAASVARYDPAAEDLHCTDLGNARRLITRYGHLLRYCFPWRKWLVWDGRRWAPDNTGQVFRFAHETTRSILDEAQAVDNKAERERLINHAIRSEQEARINAMVSVARSLLGSQVTPDLLDSDDWLLNVLNDTIDLGTGKLREHRREDLITKIAPVEYDPAAECPLWLEVLDRIMSRNEKLIAYLQRLFGMYLTGDISVQELFIFWGGGANGKNTVLDTIIGLMGDYACVAPPDLLTAKGRNEHPTEIADLFGRRLVVVSEMDQGRQLRTSFVKQITGDQYLKCRRMREDFWQFRRTHKTVLVTNNKPVVRESSKAMWRRIRLVPFTVTIPDEEQDHHLLEKLRAEWPGILRWLVEGCLLWQKDGLGTPTVVAAATDTYRVEQDQLAQFVAECCQRGGDLYVTRGDVWEAFQAWGKRVGEDHPLGRNELYEQLRSGNFCDGWATVGSRRTRVFEGIGLCR